MFFTKRYIKATVLMVSLLFIKAQLYSQCGYSSLIIHFPTTVNGITVNETNTEATQYWNTPNDTITYCGVLSGTLELGYIGYYSSPFTQTLTFSSPVNNIVYIINASDTSSGGVESFSFAVNAGTLSCNQVNNSGSSCLYTQQGNLFKANSESGVNGSMGNAAYITISSTIAYDTIRVYGTGGMGGSLMSLCASSITGIKNNAIDESLNIYPNPANTTINITYNLQVATCSLYDVLGNEVISTKEKNIDISNLQNGVYFLSVKTAEGVLSKKVIVQH